MSPLTIKMTHGEQHRRLATFTTASLQDISDRARKAFGVKGSLEFGYKDEYDDVITVMTPDEWVEAMSVAACHVTSVFKINVRVVDTAKPVDKAKPRADRANLLAAIQKGSKLKKSPNQPPMIDRLSIVCASCLMATCFAKLHQAAEPEEGKDLVRGKPFSKLVGRVLGWEKVMSELQGRIESRLLPPLATRQRHRLLDEIHARARKQPIGTEKEGKSRAVQRRIRDKVAANAHEKLMAEVRSRKQATAAIGPAAAEAAADDDDPRQIDEDRRRRRPGAPG